MMSYNYFFHYLFIDKIRQKDKHNPAFFEI